MKRRIILQRTRIPVSVEGESEQSLIKWLQQLADQQKLNVHLDCHVLGGGGYKTMLQGAILYRKRKEGYKAKNSILLVDGDRTERDDGWSFSLLKQAASKHKINVCVQQPNLEGFLLRLMPGKESLQPSAQAVQKHLRSVWPDYQKPVDARTLGAKFSLNDLLRVAQLDQEISELLKIIGLRKWCAK